MICTVSSPQDEGRQFSEELREAGLQVELVEDDQAPAQLEWASLLLVGADTVFRCGTVSNKAGTRALAEAAAEVTVPTVVACEVIKLAPWTAADADLEGAGQFDLTPPTLIDHLVTEEGAYPTEGSAPSPTERPSLQEGYDRCAAVARSEAT